MTELAEPWYGAADTDDGANDERASDTFVSFVESLRQESERLQTLARGCEATARELAEREASLEARRQALDDQRQELEGRRAELERWQQQLDTLAAEADRANARIAEAADREAGLRAFAHDLLQRYSGSDDG